MLTKDCKEKILKSFGRSEKDTGSSEVQIALLTERINQISAHIQKFPKDHHSRRGLLKLVSRRKAYYTYLQHHDKKRFDALVSKLNQGK